MLTRLRELLQKPGIIRSLGAHDVFTARLIEAAGLETVFIGGFGASASLLGLPHVGFLTMTEMADAVRRMAQRRRHRARRSAQCRSHRSRVRASRGGGHPPRRPGYSQALRTFPGQAGYPRG